MNNKKAMAITMAAINGTQMMPGLALPLMQMASEAPSYVAGLDVIDGGKLFDELFFTTAHAAITSNVSTSVSGETIEANQTQNVNAGGSTTDTTINGGWQRVNAGGSATSTTISGGMQNVGPGGIATNTTINRGMQDVYGSATSTTINGGSQSVYGSVTSTTINSGAQYVFDGGSATSTTINSGGEQSVNGSATSTTINGGTQNVVYGGTATNTTINSGRQNVSNRGTATSTTISGGTQNVSSGGTATNTTINSGGKQNVDAGGSATSTTINANGLQTVEGTAAGTTVNASGYQDVSNGGTATGTTINSNGLQTVMGGGTATDTAVNEGGTLNVWREGTIQGTTTLNKGIIEIGEALGIGGTIALGGNLDATNGGTIAFVGTDVGRNVTINNMTGDATFRINTDVAAGKSDHITIASAANGGTHKVQVGYDKFFEESKAGKVTADESIEFADAPEGTTFSAEATEYGAYKYTAEIGAMVDETENGRVKYGVSGIVGEEGGLSASELVYAGMETAAGSMMTLRQENAALTKRIGQLREQGDNGGIWAQAYGGKQEADSREGRSFKQSGSGIAVGYDNKIAEAETGTWYVGYTVGYLKNDLTMQASDGENKSLAIGVYGAWQGKDGEFGNITLKQSRLTNDFTSHLLNGKTDSGDYDNWGTTLGAEYGYRKQLKDNAYIEPAISFTYGRIGGADYTTREGMLAKTDGMNTFVGKLGLTYGQQMGSANGYVRIAAAREFSASAKTSMHMGTLKAVEVEEDFKQSWLEFALGLSGKTGDNSSGYLELMRTNGGKTQTPWQLSAGMRWTL